MGEAGVARSYSD